MVHYVLFGSSDHFLQGLQQTLKVVIIFNSISEMSMNRIRLTDPQPNNQSFSHQQSLNHQFEPKHKKKGSLYQKPSRTPNYHRLKTDERQSSAILKNQALNSCAASMHLAHSTFSISKLNKAHKILPSEPKKNKKGKQTISVINLNKPLQESKAKVSSTITKRKHSNVDFGQKIKEKIEDFKVLSTCLDEYVKQQRRNNSEANLSQIIKIIGAFNRSQIAPLSKPLQRLIGEIVSSIQNSLPQPQLKSILKKSISFQSPHRPNPSEEEGTVKKGLANRQYEKKGEQNSSGDVKKLEENLSRLKYQSNRLKYFLDEISSTKGKEKKKDERTQKEKEKLEQLRKLKQIAQEQARIIQELQNSSEGNQTFRSDQK